MIHRCRWQFSAGPPNIEKIESKWDIKELIKVLEKVGSAQNSELVIDAARALARIGACQAVEPRYVALSRSQSFCNPQDV
jgi:hypothetical protein